MNPKADFFFEKAGRWQKETELLRKIVLACGLSEEVKWGCPCYTEGGRNIVLIHYFKDYCALLLFKGALLKDEAGLLVQQTENVQGARQVRFTSLSQIKAQQASIKAYIYEAIEVEKAGLKVPLKKTAEFAMPEEFAATLKKDAVLRKAFEALTPGRQRAYLLHFGSAKQAATRTARIEKSRQAILAGKGLND
ncbi:MAG: hypothetical protein EOO15_09240 [Chitinophagaceae bacterium]|nr:MAG: hypothetical protein EOO15_09240 [Chitinophagaceae bacterium]